MGAESPRGQRAGGQGAAAAGARSKSDAAPGRPARGTSRITASQAAPVVPIRPTAIACASGSWRARIRALRTRSACGLRWAAQPHL